MFDRCNEVIPRSKNPKSTLSSLGISLNTIGRQEKAHLRTQLNGSQLMSSKIVEPRLTKKEGAHEVVVSGNTSLTHEAEVRSAVHRNIESIETEPADASFERASATRAASQGRDSSQDKRKETQFESFGHLPDTMCSRIEPMEVN